MNGEEKLGDLIIDVYKNLKTRIERDLKVYEIGMGQLQILMVFFQKTEGSFTQNELVKILGVDKGNISRSLIKLSAKGYIEPVEGRKLYQLSEKGKQLKSEIISAFIHINAVMTRGTNATQVDQTIQTLNRLNENLENSI